MKLQVVHGLDSNGVTLLDRDDLVANAHRVQLIPQTTAILGIRGLGFAYGLVVDNERDADTTVVKMTT